MSRGLDAQWTAALVELGFRTAYFARFEFKSGTTFASTIESAMSISGTGDAAMDGNTFSPIADGNVIGVGSNTYSYEGSEAFEFTLALSPDASATLQATLVDADEYQGRLCYVWRGLQLTPATESAPASWGFKRIRSGYMDSLSSRHGATSDEMRLTVEAHTAYVARASGRTWLDQTVFWPADTGADYIVACSNGDPRAARSGAARDALFYGRDGGRR
jgi:hypothetical protein